MSPGSKFHLVSFMPLAPGLPPPLEPKPLGRPGCQPASPAVSVAAALVSLKLAGETGTQQRPTKFSVM